MPYIAQAVHYTAAGVCEAAWITEIPPQIPEAPLRAHLMVAAHCTISFAADIPYSPDGRDGTWHPVETSAPCPTGH